MKKWAAKPAPKIDEGERRVVGWGSSRGAIYADDMEDRHRKSCVRMALEQIADAEGDVEGFIAQQDERAKKSPVVAAAIGRRLLDAGRPQEALSAIDFANLGGGMAVPEWEQVRIDTLVALGSLEEAQSFRWKSFTRTLSATHLRAFLKKVPDFEDFDAEQRAMDHASRADIHEALAFFVAWPALDRASKLVIDKSTELDGDRYELLTPAADELGEKYSLAATLIRRAMIDFSLDRAKASRYRHAARHLAECASLASRIEDYGSFPDHESYVGGLQVAHGRKVGFWQA